jgi:small-conductance mechanosensitive channel/CRP-like cAMP-binding protein
MTVGLATGLVLLVLALAARGASVNRHVRVRLLVSAFALALYVLADAAAIHGARSPELAQIVSLKPLLLAFGAINAVVALLLNPWREDRLPDRFPNIVQDSIVIALFAAAATLLLPEKIFATTAVGAVVIGFALQDTLGNLFAGLAIQIEKPFRVGQWVHIAGKDGLVRAITWRATKIRTKAGNFVIVPNSALSRDTITNYSEPTTDTCVELEVGASYDTPPNEVKAVILAAIKDEPLISREQAPEVLLVDFAASAVTYRIRVWTTDFSADEKICDHIRSAIYYAFRRAAIVIPYPIQVQVEGSVARAERGGAENVVGTVELFASLSPAELAELTRAARRNLYGAGETVVRQGEAGSSMFIVARGEAVVTIEPSHQEVARVSPGGFFGEMSLLTGAPRAATVKTRVDSELLEITADTFRQFVLANPAAVEQIGGAAAARAAELDRHRAAGEPQATVEPPSTFVTRVRRFLRLH